MAAMRPGAAVPNDAGIVTGVPATVIGLLSVEREVMESRLPPVEAASGSEARVESEPEARVEPEPDLVEPEPEPAPDTPPELVVETFAAPPVPVAHCVVPCLSQA